MKIGELARLSGVASSRIRFYEASGLLRPAERQANGYREYAPEALTRLGIILRAQGAGFTLDEIRALLPPDLDKWQHEALVQGLERKIGEIEQLERQLAQNKQGLLALLREIGERSKSGDCTGKAREVLDRMRIA